MAAAFLGWSMLVGCNSPGKDERSALPTPEQAMPLPPAPPVKKDEPKPEPKKSPPHVKFRKNKDYTYSWEISGDDVDGILRTDKKLRDATAKIKPQYPAKTDSHAAEE